MMRLQVRFLKYLVFVLLLTAATVLGEMSVKSDFGPWMLDVSKMPPRSDVPVSVISEADAGQLFQSFLADKTIPFRYPIDGCYARATKMAQIAEKKKIKMAKIYVEGFLVVKTDYEEMAEVNWGWHVAPIAYVKKATGETEVRVFDPSLFDRPVTIEEWKQKMLANSDAKISAVYMGSRFQYFPKNFEQEKKKWVDDDLRNVDQVMREYRPLQFHHRQANETLPSRQGVQ